MQPLRPGHYWKTPFHWESGCPLPPSTSSLDFVAVSDEALRPMIGAVLSASMDESDRFNIQRIGVAAAVQEVYDLLPQYFDRRPDWWRIGRDDRGDPVGFVLPVIFKEERFWKDGRPEGTIFYMGVLPAHRGRRLGVEMVHEATRTLLAAGCWRIVCDTGTDNAPMVQAFRLAGYVERERWQRPLA